MPRCPRRRCGPAPGLLLLLSGLLAGLLAAPAHAEQPWEAALRRARATQDREIQAAKRNKSLARVVNLYKSRLSRNATAESHYLVARVLYYDAHFDQEQLAALPERERAAAAKRVRARARAKAEEAIGHMRRALEMRPGFWFAQKSLAQLYLETGRLPDAERELGHALARRPGDLGLLKLAIAIHGAQKQMPQVERYARQVLEQDPTSVAVRMALVQCLVEQKRVSAAATEMGIVVKSHPDELQFRMNYAVLLYRLAFEGQPKDAPPRDLVPLREAGKQLRVLLRARRNSFELLSLMAEVQYYLEQREALERLLERMIRLAPSEEARKGLQKNLAWVRAGGALGAASREGALPRLAPAEASREGALPRLAPAEAAARNELTRMIEDALDPKDAAKRRAALQEYLDRGVPFLPTVLYARVDPSLEPDPPCRIMLLRLLGRMASVDAVKHIARALWDPSADVRIVAADELGHYTQGGIVLYLEPAFMNLRIDPLPTTRVVRTRLEREYNALRDALHTHTHFRDRELMAKGALRCEALAKNRARWEAYFRSERGWRRLLAALEVFPALKDPYPERYLLIRVVGDEALEVRRAAYAVLKQYGAQMQKSESPFMRKRWAGFPMLDLAEITAETTDSVKTRLMRWYQTTRGR